MPLPLVVLLPQKTRKQGEWMVVEIPVHYESKEPGEGQRGEGRADGEKEDKQRVR